MVLGLLDHLQTFWQLYLTELLGLLTDLGLLKQWHAGFLHRLKSYEIQFKYLTLFRLFSVIDGFECFRMEIRHKNIQLMLEFLKAPFLVLNIPTITYDLSDIISSIAVYTDTTLYCRFNQTFDLW